MGGRHSKSEEERQPDLTSSGSNPPATSQPSLQSTQSPPLAKQPSIKRSVSQEEMESLQPEQLFARFASEGYLDSTGTEIEPEGLQELCELLEIDPATDVAVLVLAWKCHTQTMGVFTKEEFLRGLRDLQADSLSTLQRKIPELRTFASNAAAAPFKGRTYAEFFRFVFEISREPGHKVLDIDVATALLDLLLGSIFPLTGRFKSFLSTKESLKAMSSDQWLSFLEFCKQHSNSLSNYDSDGACNE